MQNKTKDIVVVDDNPVLLRVLAEIFRECGWTVRTASEGFAALAEIRAQIPNILLSDLNMAGMSGFELLSVVRRRFPEIAVIAMSGSYSGFSVPLGIAADAFYPKGGSGIARLLEIAGLFGGHQERSLNRRPCPIWIPAAPIHVQNLETVFASCPECLRASPYALRGFNISQVLCAHCSSPIQLAVVRSFDELDETLFVPATTQTLNEHPMTSQRDFSGPSPRVCLR